ncbi:MAG: hypothetical protein EOO29_48720, partial [Comamonadaceae bacterium]
MTTPTQRQQQHSIWRRVLAALSLTVLAAGAAQALTVVSLSPQGEVARVRQVVAKFDSAAVAFGDPKAPAPFSVSCSDAAAAQGTGRQHGQGQGRQHAAPDGVLLLS